MTFLGRLKYYGFGFGLGIMIVFAMFGGRSCTTPNEQKMEELVFQDFQLSEKALCKLKCIHMSEKLLKIQAGHTIPAETQVKLKTLNELLLKIELRHFEVNYGVSSPRKESCGEYFVQPKKEFESLYNFKLLMLDCDTITRINDISINASKTCTCQ